MIYLKGCEGLYNVFLVEDEVVVREGIRNSIDWSKTEFNLCKEAPDGEIALSEIKEVKPDILITDIKMPFMNGLVLSKILKKTMPWIKIIILTGYDEFDFAKEAISIGVDEYLIKPVDSVELLLTLNKVAQVIKDEREKSLNVEQLKVEMASINYIKREYILNNLMLGMANTEEVLTYAKENKIELLAKYYLVMIIFLEVENYNYKEYLKALNCAKFIIGNDDNSILFSSGNDKNIILFKNFHKKSMEEHVFKAANTIKYEVENQTECYVSIAIGDIVEKIQEVSSSYKSADKTLKYILTFNRRKIMCFRDIYEKSSLENNAFDNSVIDKIKYAEKSDIHKIVEECLNLLGESENSSMLHRYHVLMNVISFCSKMITSLEGDPNEILEEEIKKAILISWECEDRESFGNVLRCILTKTLDFKDSQSGLKYGNLIKKARDYIEEHFGHEDISLKFVADYVGLSPNHFSSIFSQEMGETFIEYLTNVRVNKAKDMLINTNKKLSDIAYSVGYSESHYFSAIFKKYCKITPREYRRKNKKLS